MRRPFAQPLAKFFADRGTHLAAMIAYFGLLSSVSLIFLALALLGFTGRAEESSYLVEELQRLFPSQSIGDIVAVVEAITENATTLGVIGGTFLLWTSLSLFSVLESAFNIVYARPNRPFLRGKFLATLFMAGSLIILSAALVLGSFGYDPIFVPTGEDRTGAELGDDWKRANSHRARAAAGIAPCVLASERPSQPGHERDSAKPS